MNASSRAAVQLTLLVIATFLMVATAPPSWIQQGVNIVSSGLIGLLLYRMTGSRLDGWIVAVIGIIPAALDLVFPWGNSALSLNLVKEAFWLAFPLVLGMRTVVWIFRSTRITYGEIAAAIAVYLLVGSFFADLYQLFDLLEPGAILWGGNFLGTRTFADYMYFSYITMASVGYGDVTPGTPLVRVAVVTQAVFGLLYMAILVARFVSQETSETIIDEEREEATGGPRDSFEAGDAHGGGPAPGL